MTSIIVIGIIIAVLYFVTKAVIGGVANKSNSQSSTETQSAPIQRQEPEGFKPYDLPVEEISDWAIVVGVVSVRSWA